MTITEQYAEKAEDAKFKADIASVYESNCKGWAEITPTTLASEVMRSYRPLPIERHEWTIIELAAFECLKRLSAEFLKEMFEPEQTPEQAENHAAALEQYWNSKGKA